MKIVFPYSGSGGKGDSWEGIVDVELTEKDYARIVASAQKDFDDFEDDPAIYDLYRKVERAVVEQELKNALTINMLEEYREDFDLGKRISPRTVIRRYLDEQGMTIHYPYELQEPLFEEEDEEE